MFAKTSKQPPRPASAQPTAVQVSRKGMPGRLLPQVLDQQRKLNSRIRLQKPREASGSKGPASKVAPKAPVNAAAPKACCCLPPQPPSWLRSCMSRRMPVCRPARSRPKRCSPAPGLQDQRIRVYPAPRCRPDPGDRGAEEIAGANCCFRVNFMKRQDARGARRSQGRQCRPATNLSDPAWSRRPGNTKWPLARVQRRCGLPAPEYGRQ